MRAFHNSGKHLFFLLKIAISLGLSIYILYLVDIQQLGQIISNVCWFYLFPIVGLFLCFVVLGGIRIAIILRAEVNDQLPHRVVVKWYFLANAMGAFSPAQAGELSLAFFLRAHNVELTQGMAAVLLDKILMFGLFLATSLVALAYYFPRSSLSLLLSLGGVGLALMACGLNSRIRRLLKARIILRYFPRCLPACQMVVRFLLHNPGALILNLFIGVIRLLVGALMIYAALMAFGYGQADFNDVFWLNGLVRTASFIPVSINGIGLLEGAAIKAFGIEGICIPEETVLSAFLLNRAVLYGFAIGVVLWHFFRKGKGGSGPDSGAREAALGEKD
jgi:uncharacterized membrane protein YbhN (UPF0104 family)